MKYEITSKARSDLINIWEYTFENWSHTQADKYYAMLINKIEEISKNPDLGRSYNHLRKSYWGIIVKSHIVFYRRKSAKHIEIMRILHRRMDLESRIKD